jgi:hypothetical protein
MQDEALNCAMVNVPSRPMVGEAEVCGAGEAKPKILMTSFGPVVLVPWQALLTGCMSLP